MDFVVEKKDPSSIAFIPSLPELGEGDVLVRIQHFALTANNISYAVTGDALKYWDFFLVGKEKEKSKRGRIPVWGYGIIVASRQCPAIITQPKNRQQQPVIKIYGYFPMSQYAVLHPIHVTATDFVDGAPHRRGLPAVYNQYMFCDQDPFYNFSASSSTTPLPSSSSSWNGGSTLSTSRQNPSQEQNQKIKKLVHEAMMVLRPLYFTSWLLVDFFFATRLLRRQHHDSFRRLVQDSHWIGLYVATSAIAITTTATAKGT